MILKYNSSPFKNYLKTKITKEKKKAFNVYGSTAISYICI